MRKYCYSALLALVAGSVAIAAPVNTGRQSAPAVIQPTPALVTHGIGLKKEDLIRFLQQGFPGNIDRAKLPPKPAEKSQLAIDAMERLTQLRAQDAVDLFISIASMQLPAGVEMLVQEDLNKTSPEGRQDFRNKALRLLQYNAIVALGVLGDQRAVPAIRQAFISELSAAAKIQYVLSLAMLGDGSGIDYLLSVIAQENRRESAAAAKVFYFMTGQDFGYTENTSARARRARAKMYKDWWKSNRTKFQIDTAAIIARRAQPDTPVVFEPRSTRDLLKLATHYFDFENKLNTEEARKKIATAGRSINKDLEKVATDPLEDLDVRMEAVNWYFEINRQDSRTLLKKLRRDENPEIVDKAKSLMEQIDNDEMPAQPQTITRR